MATTGKQGRDVSRPTATRPPGIVPTRLEPPRLPATCVARHDLAAAVLRGFEGRLALILAGAGWGKSTLLAQAVARCGRPWAWLSCDRRLETAGAFLAHVAAGVARRFPAVGASLRGPPERRVATLVDALTAVDDDLVIVIDDAHALWGHPAGDALLDLIKDAPAHVHIALASRSDPPFHLARLRAGGMLVLSEASLAFTAPETGELLAALGRPTDDRRARELHRRTEGWPAGLILLALAPGPRGVEPMKPDESAFAYLAEEVLAQRRPEEEALLLDTALLERFTPELAAAVGGRGDVAPLLRRLEAEHVFLVRLGGDGEWYRYHGLLREALARRLAAEGAEALAGRHRRAAAAWLAAEEVEEAVPHLLAAGDLVDAADVLEDVAEAMALGERAGQLEEWLARIPPAVLSTRPGLQAARALLLHLDNHHDEAVRLLREAVEGFAARGDGERAAASLLRLLQVALSAGRPHLGLEAAEEWLPRLPTDARSAPAVLLAAAFCSGWLVLRQPPEAQRFLLDTALLDRFTPALAAHVSGRTDAAAVLRRLDADGVIVSEGGDKARYRHHVLLREALRRRLVADGPEALAASRRRTAEALVEAGEAGETATRPLAAGNGVGAAPGPPPALGSPGPRASRPTLRITALGRLTVERNGGRIAELSEGGRRPRVLLAILLAADGPVHRERLMEWLWAHLPPARARAALHTAAHTLRRALDPAGARGNGFDPVPVDGESYRLALSEDDGCDVSRFLKRVAAACRASPTERLPRLLEAEAAVTGTFLSEWPYEPWAEGRRAELERAHHLVLDELARQLSAGDRHAEAARRYERLVAMEPEREAWHRALMDTYARAGERGLALRQHDACRRILRERLGVEPSAETRELHRRILG